MLGFESVPCGFWSFPWEVEILAHHRAHSGVAVHFASEVLREYLEFIFLQYDLRLIVFYAARHLAHVSIEVLLLFWCLLFVVSRSSALNFRK